MSNTMGLGGRLGDCQNRAGEKNRKKKKRIFNWQPIVHSVYSNSHPSFILVSNGNALSSFRAYGYATHTFVNNDVFYFVASSHSVIEVFLKFDPPKLEARGPVRGSGLEQLDNLYYSVRSASIPQLLCTSVHTQHMANEQETVWTEFAKKC